MHTNIRSILLALALGGFLASPAFAASSGAHAATEGVHAQQSRMKTCNAEAKGKKGEERKTFMKSCLKGESAGAAEHKHEAAASGKRLSSSQQRMKDCNVQAKGKKGDERKAFMKSCLTTKK